MKAVVGLVICVGLLAGCGQSEKTTVVKHVTQKGNSERTAHTLKEALKEYKWVKVVSSDDFRSSTGQLTVVVKLDPNTGDGTQVGQVINQTTKMWNDLDKKPKKVTVGVMEDDTRTFQFSTTDGKTVEVEKTTPYLTNYLKKTGVLK